LRGIKEGGLRLGIVLGMADLLLCGLFPLLFTSFQSLFNRQAVLYPYVLSSFLFSYSIQKKNLAFSSYLFTRGTLCMLRASSLFEIIIIFLGFLSGFNGTGDLIYRNIVNQHIY